MLLLILQAGFTLRHLLLLRCQSFSVSLNCTPIDWFRCCKLAVLSMRSMLGVLGMLGMLGTATE